MKKTTQAQDVPSTEAVPQTWYTLGEAAAFLVVREDDLNALLPDTAIAVESRLIEEFTRAEVEIMETFIREVRKFSAESVYGGGDL